MCRNKQGRSHLAVHNQPRSPPPQATKRHWHTGGILRILYACRLQRSRLQAGREWVGMDMDKENEHDGMRRNEGRYYTT